MQASFPNPKSHPAPRPIRQAPLRTEVRKNVVLIPQRAVQQLQSMQTVFTLLDRTTRFSCVSSQRRSGSETT